MASSFTRGAQTMNSMFFKPAMRKCSYHKKSSSSCADSTQESMKMDAEEVKCKSFAGDNEGSSWVPHERTGIYYPKGQEKVMDQVPLAAGKDAPTIHWFSSNDHTFN